MGSETAAEETERRFTYDAWNRMTAVSTTQATIATYSYDGLHRRIVKEVVNDTTYQYYHNESWQVVAVDTGEPNGGYPLLQYVWDVRYVDAPIALLCDGNQNGLDYEEPQDYCLYYCQDANFNVTALVAKDGSVAERVSQI